MPAKLIDQTDNKLTIQFTTELTGQMLKDEQALQKSLNEAGQVAMEPMIKQFDTNGEPIRVNGVKHTVKGDILTRHLKADVLMFLWKKMAVWFSTRHHVTPRLSRVNMPASALIRYVKIYSNVTAEIFPATMPRNSATLSVLSLSSTNLSGSMNCLNLTGLFVLLPLAWMVPVC